MIHERNCHLSPREEEIIQLAAEGLTDAGIANRLGISEGTVGTYWGRIRTKLGPYPRAELVALHVRGELQQCLSEAEKERDDLRFQLRQVTIDEVFFERVFDASQEGIILVDGKGMIVRANAAAHEVLGYDPGGLRERPLIDLIPQPFRDQHLQRFLETVAQPRTGPIHSHLATSGLTKLGAELPMVISVTAIQHGTEILFAGFIHCGA